LLDSLLQEIQNAREYQQIIIIKVRWLTILESENVE